MPRIIQITGEQAMYRVNADTMPMLVVMHKDIDRAGRKSRVVKLLPRITKIEGMFEGNQLRMYQNDWLVLTDTVLKNEVFSYAWREPEHTH
jgi:hypothetical protein